MAEFLTIAQAAKQLGLSIETLKRWDANGKLPALRNAVNARVYTLEMLAEYLPKPKETADAN